MNGNSTENQFLSKVFLLKSVLYWQNFIENKHPSGPTVFLGYSRKVPPQVLDIL